MIRILDWLRTTLFSLFRFRTIGASVIAVDGDGKVLLVRQSYGSSGWRLPGGAVKRGETTKEAALREVNEELGLRLQENGSARLLGVYLKRIGHWDDHVSVFVVTGWSITQKQNWEIAEWALHDPSALPADTVPATRRRLSEWLDGGESHLPDRW